MRKKYIETKVEARYFTINPKEEAIQYTWLCAHGYGQLAEYFIKHFEVLSSKHKIIAPEGLHRFYLRDNAGRVGASWMTKLEREKDIKQYCTYLDQVVNEESQSKDKIIAFGFSQGAATIGRWICNTNRSLQALVLWAGAWPHDMIIYHNRKLLNSIPIYVIIGDHDQYLDDQGNAKYLRVFDDNKIEYNLIEFNGDHRIDKDTLLKLSKLLESK